MRRSSALFDARRLSRLALASVPRDFLLRRSPRRPFGPLGWLVLGAGLATLGLTLLDPARGASRRAMIRDKASSSLQRLRDGTRGRLIDARSRAREAQHAMQA